MHRFASFNQKIFAPEQINLSAISSATLYGRGVFTTVAIYNQKPFLWEKHWRRLIENAQKIGVDLSEFSEISVKTSLFELIQANKIENLRARITFFDESASSIWSFETDKKTSLLITTADFQNMKENLHLTVSPYEINSKSPLANVKSCNYLENILALEDAKRRGFDEVLRVNEKGAVVSASMANLFWIKDQKIYTSTLETGCLAGTTREFLLETQTIEEKYIDLANLLKADEIFLTSAGIGIKNIIKINEKSFENSISSGFQTKFSEKYRNFSEKY
ncbi:branched chain amino acid--2-keto-4-methylthiobutyrate aminotransferase [soil metagenome]